MPFPPFPALPDDDPLGSLKTFRDYIKAIANYMRPYQLLGASVAIPILAFAIGYLLLGFESALSWASDLVPLSFAVISVFVSVKTLRDKHQTAAIAFVLVLGFLGTLIMHSSRVHTEREHHSEMTQLGQKVEAVGAQNSQLLTAFLAKPPLTSQEVEMERRENIQKALRGEYILSHDNVSPGLLAGTEFPPADWTNRRLQELGEKWTVSETAKTLSATPVTPRSYIEFDGDFHFPQGRDEKGELLPQHNFKAGDPLFFNYFFKASGPNPVEQFPSSRALYIKPNFDDKMQWEMIAAFQHKIVTDWKSFKKKPESVTLMAGAGGFGSAFAKNDKDENRAITEDDLNALQRGTEIAFVIVEIPYEDNKKMHHLRTCRWLQPPALAPATWHYCVGFTKSD
ncbi:MAG: hypothetical protein WAN65_18345 [Candidatus Sulfotelmatobacter sp.]